MLLPPLMIPAKTAKAMLPGECLIKNASSFIFFLF